MFNDDEDIGFVICASCGARIKANRERCLRCEAPLVAWKKPELLPTWLQRWGGGTLIFGVVGVIAIAVALVMYLDSGSRPTESPAHPSSGARPATLAASGAASAGTSGSIEAPAFLDTAGRGGSDIGRGEPAAARTSFEEALEKRPDDPELLNGLGLTLERLGQTNDAIARFERASHIDPQKWAYHFNLAHALATREDWDRVIGEYRRAAGMSPGDFASQYNLAVSMHRKGDDVGAIPEFQKGIEAAPAVPLFHLGLAVSLEKVGRVSEAGREYQKYVEMAPSAPDVARVRSHLQTLGVSPSS
jgi:tetratricopeptide (TPR) repeat protein